MVGEDLELLITAVVAADDEQQARTACGGLLDQVGGRVVRAFDCSDEEPGCWSVTISLVSGERATQNVAGALARAVRTFVRRLGDEFPTPRVACEPPTAWTVLDDPALLDGLVPGAERLLVEAWAGGDPQHGDPRHREPQPGEPQPGGPQDRDPRPSDARHGDPQDRPPRHDDPRHGNPQPGDPRHGDPQHRDPRHRDPQPGGPQHGDPRHGDPQHHAPHHGGQDEPRPDPAATEAAREPGPATAAAPPEPGTRLSLRVDVAANRSAAAEWQARAVASRVARSGKITRVAPHGHLLSVHIDLGSSVHSPTMALRHAVASLGRSGWSAVERTGESETTRWSATPVPPNGIAALELTATPGPAFVWTVPD